MKASLSARFAPAAILLVPLLAIIAARLATHSDLAARHPRTAALLFLWIAADALTLAAIAKAPKHRPGLRVLLGTIAAGCIVATLAAASPVREALLDMRSVVIAMALTVIAYAGWSAIEAWHTYRRTRSFEKAASEVLPAKLVRFAAFESGMMRLALFKWGAKPLVPAGTQAFAYHRVINPMIAVFLVLQMIEIVVVDLLVSHWSRPAAIVLLALGIWGALFLIALMKGFRLYPILLGREFVRVRAGLLINLRVPIDAIEALEPSITKAETDRAEVLNAAILSHPNVILRLRSPIPHTGLFGKTRNIGRIAFRLDQPAPFIEALEARL
ncbi:hypothetical protein [Qipengyuania psychrotolerans]|uniref:Uncharacterized protein n=1 Tax=Qipengyuania psychrotolerans TaxID=2867238 RepID=A0ABX8ZEI7_9SPHN|nr:hypothetical protein [Qipengyuania psychrotolerans]QZD87402.1 hypothetical protein K3166_01425 [Qipengyuania psychrotolerans]